MPADVGRVDSGPRLLLSVDSSVTAGVLLLVGGLGIACWNLVLRRKVRRQATAYQAIAGSLREAEERLRYQAYHDALTDLPNRLLFTEHLLPELAQARRQSRPLAVLFLDLDNFKVINETLGHAAGDQLLQEVARRLKTGLRESDTVARVGGDEFSILLPELSSPVDAAMLAEKLLRLVASPVTLLGRELSVTASVGIALHPSDGNDAESLLQNADIAMYRAKDMGRNHYQLSSPATSASKALERLSMENSIWRGLQGREFELYYQPQLELQTEAVECVEALIRWPRSDGRLTEPSDFVPLAEGSRLIVPLGEWVLRSACSQAKAWQEEGLSWVRVAVNVSVREFQELDFLSKLEELLRETRLDPRSLDLEITESMAMQNVELTLAVLRQLRDIGVGVVLDDFGTGHSSLSYLKLLPVTKVKIDRSFVRDVPRDVGDAAIVSAVIAMAKTLKIKVVAEGVETAEQLDYLKAQGCDEIQGYFFSRPMPAWSIPGFLTGRGGARPRPGDE
jgi:diguanylate cyclase (GGDEF)-like protein